MLRSFAELCQRNCIPLCGWRYMRDGGFVLEGGQDSHRRWRWRGGKTRLHGRKDDGGDDEGCGGCWGEGGIVGGEGRRKREDITQVWVGD